MNPVTNKKTIVIVDDNRLIAELIKEVLLQNDTYDPVIAKVDYDAASILDFIKSRQTRLVLLDVLLPGISAFTIYDMIKEDPALRDLPLLVLTAAPDNAIKDELARRGIESYIKKPFDIDDFLARVAMSCEPPVSDA